MSSMAKLLGLLVICFLLAGCSDEQVQIERPAPIIITAESQRSAKKRSAASASVPKTGVLKAPIPVTATNKPPKANAHKIRAAKEQAKEFQKLADTLPDAAETEIAKRVPVAGGILKDFNEWKRYSISGVRTGRSRSWVESRVEPERSEIEAGKMVSYFPEDIRAVYDHDWGGQVVQVSGPQLYIDEQRLLATGDSANKVRESLGAPKKSFDSGEELWQYPKRKISIQVSMVDGKASRFTIRHKSRQKKS